MSSKSEKIVNLKLEESQFEQLIGMLDLDYIVMTDTLNRPLSLNDKIEVEVERDKAKTIKKKLLSDGYIYDKEGIFYVKCGLKESEISWIIGSLISFSTSEVTFEGANYIKNLKGYVGKGNNTDNEKLLSSGVKSLLHFYEKCGYKYLIRNKDGKLYFVKCDKDMLCKLEDTWTINVKKEVSSISFIECYIEFETVTFDEYISIESLIKK